MQPMTLGSINYSILKTYSNNVEVIFCCLRRHSYFGSAQGLIKDHPLQETYLLAFVVIKKMA